MGVPVLPVAVPGAAVSPGASNCNFANAPTFTVIDALVLADLVPSLTSLAVIVREPVVFRVTPKLPLPPDNAVLAGKLALLSVEVKPTVSMTVGTTFQFASTAFTVTLKAVPAVCALGVPVLPVLVPGAAVSPRSRICSFVKLDALTGIVALVLLAMAVCVVSEAVTVELPPVLSVILKSFVPPAKAAFAGKTAFASLEVMATVSLVLIKFQFASTAFTVTLNAVPAL